MSRLARVSFSKSPHVAAVGIAANSDPRSNFSVGGDDMGAAPFLLVGRDDFRILSFSRVDVGVYVLFVNFGEDGVSCATVMGLLADASFPRTGEGSREASWGHVPGRLSVDGILGIGGTFTSTAGSAEMAGTVA